MKFDLPIATLSKSWSENVPASPDSQKLKQPKTHQYFETQSGQEFVLDALDEHLSLYVMTSQRAEVELSDHILIQGSSGSTVYRVLEIDHYCSGFPDLWIAKLALVNSFNPSEAL
jgi:hypothetical protein